MRILVVDNDPDALQAMGNLIIELRHQLSTASCAKQALELAAEGDFDVVFCDAEMNGPTGFDVLKALHNSPGQQAEIFLMTAHPSIEGAIDAIHFGANDYLRKPISPTVIQGVASAVDHRRYASKLIEIEDPETPHAEILGNCRAMIEIVKTSTRVAATELPVMIRGESGTGKELVARLIHKQSPRAARAFVAVNCGALPDTLLESELFGHTRGAFTGADSARCGLFEEADGGTLLLDEVTETSPAFQVKLLRVLQEGEFRPLGTNSQKRVNVRVLSATNRDPQSLADQGLFRQDLLYRLQGVEIILPPLRERREDVRPMALSFLSQYSPPGRRLSITKDTMLAIERYDWPGNVRELKYLMQRLAALSSGIIRLEDLPAEIVSTREIASVINDAISEGDLPTLDELQSTYLLRVLSVVRGNKSRAAEVMGVDRKTLSRRIDRMLNEGGDKPTDPAAESSVDQGSSMHRGRMVSAAVS